MAGETERCNASARRLNPQGLFGCFVPLAPLTQHPTRPVPLYPTTLGLQWITQAKTTLALLPQPHTDSLTGPTHNSLPSVPEPAVDDASDDDEPDDAAKPRTGSRGGPGGAPCSRSGFRRVLSRSRSASQDGGRAGSRDSDGHGGGGSGGRGEGRGRPPPPDPNRVPEELGTTHLERLARIYTMACQAAPNAADHTDYMMAAHHNFMRLLTQVGWWVPHEC